MFTYKNVSDHRQAVIGNGLVDPGKLIQSPDEINSPNFELVKSVKEPAAKPK